MRYALVVAAFAAGAVAVPFINDKRAVVTDVDIVYETAYVTVTAGDEPAPAATTTTVEVPKYTNNHYGHRHSNSWSSVWESTTAETSVAYVPPPTSEAPATTSEAPSSTYVAPEPTTTSTTPVYVAPTTEAASYVPSTSAAPTTTAAAAAAPPSGYGSVSAPNAYAQKAVYHHNLHRANHSAPDVEWDEGLASTAATIASSCVYAHDVTTNGGGYGQNIAAGVEPDNITTIITDLFYNGEVGYFDGLYGQDQPSMDNFEKWGHFSQIVWKGTTHIGCATQDCSSQGLANVGSNVAAFFTVCNYKSPGNYANEYADNVGQSKNLATVNWDAGL